MLSGRRRTLVVLFVVGVIVVHAWAITTVPKEIVCPVCKTKNTFMVYASWGTYVYMWPSKYQDVYWPYTSGTTFYICKECHLSLYMWDFQKFPAEKTAEVREALKAARLARSFTHYNDVPVSEKMTVAERVYQILGRDEEFWAHFHRVKGYHLAQEKKEAEATQARVKSAELLEGLAKDPKREGQRKSLLYSLGAMQYFTGQKDRAMETLKSAASLKYHDPELDAEKNENMNQNLNAAIDDYLKRIAANDVPRDLGGE